jgi:hypothetical protein
MRGRNEYRVVRAVKRFGLGPVVYNRITVRLQKNHSILPFRVLYRLVVFVQIL